MNNTGESVGLVIDESVNLVIGIDKKCIHDWKEEPAMSGWAGDPSGECSWVCIKCGERRP